MGSHDEDTDSYAEYAYNKDVADEAESCAEDFDSMASYLSTLCSMVDQMSEADLKILSSKIQVWLDSLPRLHRHGEVSAEDGEDLPQAFLLSKMSIEAAVRDLVRPKPMVVKELHSMTRRAVSEAFEAKVRYAMRAKLDGAGE